MNLKEKLNTLASKKYPAFLVLLSLCYTVFLIMSNLFDARQISIFGFNLVPGTFFFTITYLCSDVITEVYGYKYARLIIWLAFCFNIIYIIYSFIVYILPSPDYVTYHKAFKQLLSVNWRIVLGSFLSYLVAEPLNSYLVAKTKIWLDGNFIGIRFVISTIIAATIDSFIFTILAFSGIFTFAVVLTLGFHIMLAKSIIEIMIVPFSIRLSYYLKRKDKIDRYDKDTNFTILSLNTQYPDHTNYFDKFEKK